MAMERRCESITPPHSRMVSYLCPFPPVVPISLCFPRTGQTIHTGCKIGRSSDNFTHRQGIIDLSDKFASAGLLGMPITARRLNEKGRIE